MWSNKYLCTPFKDKGRDEQGADCWGLTKIVYRNDLNIDLPDLLGYTNTKDGKGIKKLFENERLKWLKIPEGQEQPYDVAVFSIAGYETHIAIVVKRGWVVHCLKEKNTIHSDYLREKEWKTALRGFYRHVQRPDIASTV